MDDFYPEFGRRVRLARRRAHLSQEALGRLTGMNRTSITNIEAGRQRIPLHLLVSFATALDVEPMELLPGGPPAARTVIGVNSAHSLTRRRFTVAHELGHLRLHPGRPLILDAPARVNFRDHIASLATDREEIEANAFAAALLMPERLVLEAVGRLLTAGQHTPEKLAQLLAEEFQVSEAAMSYRLINLGITT